MRSLMLFFALVAIWGTALFYIVDLSTPMLAIVVILSLISHTLVILSLSLHQAAAVPLLPPALPMSVRAYCNTPLPRGCSWFWVATLLACLTYYLYLHRTWDSIRSPWEQVGSEFFALYFACTGILMLLIKKGVQARLALFAIACHFLFSVSAALIIYPVGFGFDPFIHQATEQYILDHGTITPKPFYYIGQYSLVVFFAKILSISPFWIEKILLAMCIFAVPYFVWRALVSTPLGLGAQRAVPLQGTTWLLLPFTLLILPFSYWIMPTPYNLATVFLVFVLCEAWIYLQKIEPALLVRAYGHTPLLLWIFALATLAIHPLVGIPALILPILILLKQYFPRFIQISAIILLCFAVPAVFLLQGILSGAPFENFSWQGFTPISSLFSFLNWSAWNQNFSLFYDLAYFWKVGVYWIYGAVVVLGVALSVRAYCNTPLLEKVRSLFLTSFLILLSNAFLLASFINFSNLIEYERLDYANRLIQLSFYFLFPFFLAGLYFIYQKSLKNRVFHLFLSLFLVFLLANSFYFSYPRHHIFETGRGYSVSLSDIKAVHKIEELSRCRGTARCAPTSSDGQEYIVLGNQNLGAAALREFGFRKYYGDNFFYSIPTGAPLYQKYLDMVYEQPSRETMKQAAAIAGVHQAYFVLHPYWTHFESILQNTKAVADSVYPIDGGKVWVFEFWDL
ncbi:MAG: Uncharacterized protein G01um101418_146 [Parcubacteria group bacterium Gr01-1014_18]|nr:MAG: Uncharacterized protein Greene041636_451 [Parcubacteria group bacterium Greene0416_36]TSC81473.1 MAG: Uncharacterized protein G01um101418_146 [Parcubacteria group bacterium Gr01-1014_18]TSC99071.1 MAG: Uncharacterized protein Greene101420_427 [Parcubacteria group bacterium Greene1014_20]TSD07248.1 MAG: Uncharacterized protein Greene07142_264 [Parcubacteria group bacterium Greene0714_2]